jgi:hypothetical protein
MRQNDTVKRRMLKMRRKILTICTGIIAGLIIAGGICFYLFSWHSTSAFGGYWDETVAFQDLLELHEDGYLYGEDWDNPKWRARGETDICMRFVTLELNMIIKQGEWVYRVFDENGREVFCHTFQKGTYENACYDIGYLGYSYSETEKFSADFEGTGKYKFISKYRGYDKIFHH